MPLPIIGIIIACISIPFLVYAGERTTGRRIPRPNLFRSLSAPTPLLAGEIESKTSDEGKKEQVRANASRRRRTTEGTGVMRVATNASWSSDESYVRDVGGAAD